MVLGCGAIRSYDSGIIKVKRIYFVLNKLGQGIASTILKELEYLDSILNYYKLVLETEKKKPKALTLYTLMGIK